MLLEWKWKIVILDWKIILVIRVMLGLLLLWIIRWFHLSFHRIKVREHFCMKVLDLIWLIMKIISFIILSRLKLLLFPRIKRQRLLLRLELLLLLPLVCKDSTMQELFFQDPFISSATKLFQNNNMVTSKSFKILLTGFYIKEVLWEWKVCPIMELMLIINRRYSM